MQLITFQRKRANRRIVNEGALLDLLRTYAPVQVVEFNSSHSFQQQVETMSHTGVFISVRALYLALHTPHSMSPACFAAITRAECPSGQGLYFLASLRRTS